MATYTQAAQTILSHQAHTHSTIDVSVVGSALDVKTSLSGTVYFYHANIETTANATGVEYILQGSWNTTSSVNEDWIDLITWQTGTTAAVASEITGTEASGETTIAVDADPTAAFTRGIQIYIQDAGTLANSEWARCSHSATSADIVTIMDGLTTGKDAADTMWTQAESAAFNIPNLSGMNFIRGIVLHTASTGSNIHFKMELVEVTAIA